MRTVTSMSTGVTLMVDIYWKELEEYRYSVFDKFNIPYDTIGLSWGIYIEENMGWPRGNELVYETGHHGKYDPDKDYSQCRGMYMNLPVKGEHVDEVKSLVGFRERKLPGYQRSCVLCGGTR